MADTKEAEGAKAGVSVVGKTGVSVQLDGIVLPIGPPALEDKDDGRAAAAAMGTARRERRSMAVAGLVEVEICKSIV